MTVNVETLDDRAAMKALGEVTEQWFEARGLEANKVLRQTEKYAQRNKLAIPEWATDASQATPEAGKAAKKALKLLLEDDDPEVQAWTRKAVSETEGTKAQIIDPLSIGLLLGGLILASRVKKIDKHGVEFYEGIPAELAKVLKASTSFFGHLGS